MGLLEIAVPAHVGVVCRCGGEQARFIVGLMEIVVLENGFELLVRKHPVLKALAAGEVYEFTLILPV